MTPMDDLIKKLAEAKEGSAELNAEIAYHIMASRPDITMHKDSKPGDLVFAFWEGGICHNCTRWEPFTQSIDAALPDEDIVEVKRASNGMWWARDSRLPEVIGGVGHTEALARRCAALVARSHVGAG